MEKEKRNEKIEFKVSPTEKKKIEENFLRSGCASMSDYLRRISTSGAQVTFSVNMPNVLRVKQASLDDGDGGEERQQKSVTR